MSYALRNSLTIAVLLLVVLGGGYYWVGVRQVEQLESRQARYDELKAELEVVESILAIFDSTKAELDTLKARWQAQDQVVPATDTPDRTLAYLDELQKLAGGRLKFDFLFKVREDYERYSTNIYGVQGKGSFETLYSFLWHLEHGHNFYTVDRLQVVYREPDTGERGDDWEWVQFSMVLRAYFQPSSRVENLPPSRGRPNPAPLALNYFRPLITRTLPPNTEGLLELDGALLKGLTNNTVFVEDRNRALHVLERGQRIYLGWLDRVDIRRNRAEFVLNKGGIWERVSLTVELNEESE